MNKSEAINKIKDILGLPKASDVVNATEDVVETPAEAVVETVEEVALVDVKTTDNLIIRIDSNTPSQGAKVSQILEDGTVATLNDDTYILAETGESIVVSGSSIVEVIPAPAPEEIPAEDAVETPEVEVEVESPEADPMSELIMAIAVLSDRVAALEAAQGTAMEQQVEMSKVVEEIAGKPAGSPVKLEKEGFSTKEKKFSALESIRNIRAGK
jgi:hypothetical protein